MPLRVPFLASILMGHMKKKLLPFILALVSSALLSCRQNGGSKTYLLLRNGDLFAESSISSYPSGSYRVNLPKETLAELENGESEFVMWGEEGCQACEKFFDSFAAYCYENKLKYDCYYVDDSGVSGVNDATAIFDKKFPEYIDQVKSEFPSATIDRGFGSFYPSLFVMNDSSYKEITVGSVSKKALGRLLTDVADYSNIYEFKTLEGKNAKGNEVSTPSFLLDFSDEESKNFYYETLYPKAARSSKETYLYDFHSMDGDNRAAFCGDFAISEYQPSLKFENKIYALSDEKERAEALSIISSYY